MAKQQSNILEKSTQEIPYGYCRCGCGQKTTIIKYNNTARSYIKGQPHKFISNHNLVGSAHHSWKGGRSISEEGYILSHTPGHIRASNSGYIGEHILIAEKALGKSLPPGAQVHHVNNTKDSGPLVICQDHVYHLLLHRRTRAYKACGHANWRKCKFCKQWDDPQNMFVPKNRTAYHSNCVNTYNRYRYKLNRLTKMADV